MAGLTLNDGTATGELIKLADANNNVDVTLTAGVWTSYSVRVGVDAGWSLTGPDGHTAALIGSGGATDPEDKAFTPDRPGRYLVTFQGFDGVGQVNLTALYEARSALFAEAFPAPGEGLSYDAFRGWFTALEERARRLASVMLGACKLISFTTDAFTAISKGSLVELSGFERPFNGGAAADTAFAAPEAVAARVNVLSSLPFGPAVLGVVLDDVAVSSVGVALVEGFVPFDTATPGFSSYAALYVSDFGELSSTPGTSTRQVGYCYASGGETVGASPIGHIYFNGYPEYSTTLNAQDKLVTERTLLAGMNTIAAGGPEVVGMDRLRPSDVLNPSGAGARVSLSSVVFRVAGLITDVTESYYVELYNDDSQQLVSSVTVSSVQLQEYQGFVTLGTGSGEMDPASTATYSVRVRSGSGNFDPAKEVVLTSVALVCIGGF